MTPTNPAAPPAGSAQASACPCTLTTPCNPACSCVEPFSSFGCSRCARYGSEEQRRKRAEELAAIIDAGKARVDAATRELRQALSLEQRNVVAYAQREATALRSQAEGPLSIVTLLRERAQDIADTLDALREMVKGKP